LASFFFFLFFSLGWKNILDRMEKEQSWCIQAITLTGKKDAYDSEYETDVTTLQGNFRSKDVTLWKRV
jgi:hypothetical protein